MTEFTGNLPGRIFISYRREDTAFPAGWLFDRLASHFGRDQVFKDIDSIDLGDDFIEVITTAVGSCDVLLALIGGRWLTITGQDGHRRLDNPDDFVRLEIETALARDVRVIPILVDVDQMPRAGELPPSLTKLVRRQALELSPNRFETDIQRLLRVLDRTIAEAQTQARQQAEEKARRQAEEKARQQAEEKARREAEEAAARQRQVEQLQGQLRERASVQDWQAVVAASGELAALDPAAADPDGLASAAREQIARRQLAEEKARQAREEEARQSLGADLRSAAIRATPTSTVKSSGDQPEWTANLTSSYASTRHIVITLSHESHTLDVMASVIRPSIIMLDGTAVARKNFSIGNKNLGTGYRKHAFSIPDGQERRKAEVWCNSAITKLKIIVDGRVLYEEGLTDTGV
jgi:TIR domain